jgi:hypothetical protein
MCLEVSTRMWKSVLLIAFGWVLTLCVCEIDNFNCVVTTCNSFTVTTLRRYKCNFTKCLSYNKEDVCGRLWIKFLFKNFCRVGIGIAQWYSVGLRAGWSRVLVPARAGNFSLCHRAQIGSRAHPASYAVDTGDSFPGSKRPGREAVRSPLTSAEVKNAWCCTSTP